MVVASTQQAILDTALSLIQSRGYNGFSYHNIADQIGIRAASIHYYFPRKSDLGRFLIVDYRNRFREALENIDLNYQEAPARLQQFCNLFIQTLARESRMCLCGILATGIGTLPPEIADEVKGFIKDTERWLTNVLASGLDAGSLKFNGTPEEQSRITLAFIEGAMMMSRAMDDKRYFEKLTRHFFVSLNSGPGQ